MKAEFFYSLVKGQRIGYPLSRPSQAAFTGEGVAGGTHSTCQLESVPSFAGSRVPVPILFGLGGAINLIREILAPD